MDSAINLESTSRHWMAGMLGGQTPHWDAQALLAFDDLVALARDEGIAAVLHASIGTTENAVGVPGELRMRLAAADLQMQATERQRSTETRRVLAALAQAGITVLVLKGAALALWAYDAPHQRARVDLDLLFRDHADLVRVTEVLASLGYIASDAPVNGITFETVFHRRDAAGQSSWIDAHWRMANHPLYAECFSFDELLHDAIVLPGVPAARGLGVVHAFLHACIHRVSNLAIGSGDRLIWLFDLHRIATHLSAAHWTQLRELAATRQLAGPAASAMHACTRWFGTHWPEKTLHELDVLATRESFQLGRAHQRWYHEWKIFRALPLPRRPGFLLHKLFPAPHYMRSRYGVTQAWQLPLAYLRRWSIGFGILWRYLRARRHS